MRRCRGRRGSRGSSPGRLRPSNPHSRRRRAAAMADRVAACVDEPMATTAPSAMTPGPIARSHRCSAMSLTSPGGGRRRAEARPASSQAALIGRLSAAGGRPAASGWACATLRSQPRTTPRGREAGAIPAQSRYGDRPLGGRKSGRRPTVHCSNLREKGRQDRAIHRISPSLRRRSEGLRDSSRPSRSYHHPEAPRVSTPRSPFRPLLALVALAALLFGACSGTAASPSPVPCRQRRAPRSPPPPRPPPATPAPTPAPAFPANLTDDEGTAVAIPAEPQKIVSLTPADTEILFAIGAGDRVVAQRRATIADYPTAASAAARRGDLRRRSTSRRSSASTPTSSSPAGSASHPPDAIAQLRVARDPGPRRLRAVRRRRLQGHRAHRGRGRRCRRRPTALTDAMQTEMTAIADAASAAAAAAGTKPRVFYDVGYTDATGQIYGAAEDSFLAEMVGPARGRRHHRRPGHLRDPARDAHRDAIRRSSSWASTRSTRRPRRPSRSATGWSRPDRGQERRHPPGPGHRDHPSGAAPADRAAQPRAGDVPGPRPPVAAAGH